MDISTVYEQHLWSNTAADKALKRQYMQNNNMVTSDNTRCTRFFAYLLLFRPRELNIMSPLVSIAFVYTREANEIRVESSLFEIKGHFTYLCFSDSLTISRGICT